MPCRAVPLTMIAASGLVAKPYRIVRPQLLAAMLVWFGHRFYVRLIEKRQPTELATRGMARELGTGLLLGAGLVTLTFAVLAALGAYRFDGFNALRVMGAAASAASERRFTTSAAPNAVGPAGAVN